MDDIRKIINDNKIEFISLKWVDIEGQLRQIDMPVKQFESRNSELQDYNLIPYFNTAFIDPFRSLPTLNILCSYNILDTRQIAISTNEFLINQNIDLKIAQAIEFFIFDDNGDNVRSANNMDHEGEYKKNKDEEQASKFAVDPFDKLVNIRAEISKILQEIGIDVSLHYHSSYPSQCSIALLQVPFIQAADNLIIAKYVIRQVVASYGKTATFMPNPTAGQRSLLKLQLHLNDMPKSKLKYYLNQLYHNAKYINAFTNSSLNSYKSTIPNDMFLISKENDQNILNISFLDTDSNPYISLSSLIAALFNSEEETETISDLSKPLPPLNLQNTLESALSMLSSSDKKSYKFLSPYFAQEIIDQYINNIKRKL